MEGSLEHVAHSLGLFVVLYLGMVYALKQSESVALKRSIFLATFALLYMVVFGHGGPSMSKLKNFWGF